MATRKYDAEIDPDKSLLSDNDVDESLWESPVKSAQDNITNEDSFKRSIPGKPAYVDLQAREDILRQELTNVRKVNEAIEGVIQSLDKAKQNMKTVNGTVSAASTLLNTWTRILSQTEHNQRLILDPSWQGATQDIADMEEEALAKQQAAERRETEEQERKAAAARKAEEEERRKSEVAAKQPKPALRGRGRATGRGTYSSHTGNTSMASTSTANSSVARGAASTRRTTSGIGRGGIARGTRGRS